MTTAQWQAVPDPVAELLRTLSKLLSSTEFYLAGGTALALVEGHRISEDLDLFAPSLADPETLYRSIRELDAEAVATVIEERTLYVEVGDVVASFFAYDYPLLRPPFELVPEVIPLARHEDIAAMKLAAIASRGSRKDFVDLWTIVSRHASLAEYLDCYREKYVGHDIGHVVRSLTYFDDADAEPPLRLLIDVEWTQIKADLTRWSLELLGSH